MLSSLVIGYNRTEICFVFINILFSKNKDMVPKILQDWCDGQHLASHSYQMEYRQSVNHHMPFLQYGCLWLVNSCLSLIYINTHAQEWGKYLP